MIKKRQLFKCTNCGYEVRLQAWKAECPSCRSGFTLVMVAAEEEKSRSRHLGYIPAIFSAAYLALTLFSPGLTLSTRLPWPSTQAAILAVTILSLTSSTVGNFLAAASGIIFVIAHLLIMTPTTLGEVGAMLLLVCLAAAAIINEMSIKGVVKKKYG